MEQGKTNPRNGLRALIDELYALVARSGSSVSIADSALFGNGLAGDVVVSANDSSFGGVRISYRSLTINAGVTVTLAAPYHALVLRVQNKITIGGTIDGRAQVDGDDNIEDFLIGEQFGADGGGSGGGGAGQNVNGQDGVDGGNANLLLGNLPIGAAFPISFGAPGTGGANGAPGVDGGDAVQAVAVGYDPLAIQSFLNLYGMPNTVLGGAAGLDGGAGKNGGKGGVGSGPGGVPGSGGGPGLGGFGGAIVYLVCPEIEILASASILTDASAGSDGHAGTNGGNAGAGTGDGGGGGGSGGGGGGGGNAGPIVFVTKKLTIHPGVTISALGAIGGIGGLSGLGGTGDAPNGFDGGKGGKGADGVAGFDWPGGYTLIQL